MALHRTYDQQVCSIASTLEVVGERWSLLIVRDAMFGLRRFEQFQSSLGIARNVLQARLEHLVAHGVLSREPYQERPTRHAYVLTDKGLDLWPTIVALLQWGDAHADLPDGPPMLIRHRGCGGAVDRHRICERCGQRLTARDALARPSRSPVPTYPLTPRTRDQAAAAR